MTQKLTKFAECICAIRSIQKSFAEFYFYDRLLHLLDFYFRLTPNSFLKKLIFTRKVSTHFLKFLRRIFNYFAKIKFSEFCQKDILPVVIIFILYLSKTSVQCTTEKKFMVHCASLHANYYFCSLQVVLTSLKTQDTTSNKNLSRVRDDVDEIGTQT